MSKRLAYVNEAGNAIVKVDNTTTLEPPVAGEVVNRDSVRVGSLIHIPHGTDGSALIDTPHVLACVWYGQPDSYRRFAYTLRMLGMVLSLSCRSSER